MFSNSIPMTREEQLVFCKQCISREMDMTQGLVCSLSGEKANFIGECSDYNYDESVNIELDDKKAVDRDDIESSLSSDVYEKLRWEQNYQTALISGLVVGIVGAVLWAAITVVTGYQIGYMAVAIGVGVGFAMRTMGKGMDPVFGITGAAIAVLSCVLGNVLSIIGFVADASGLAYMDALMQFDYAYILSLMEETVNFREVLFYGFAGFAGYKYSFRKFTESDLASLK